MSHGSVHRKSNGRDEEERRRGLVMAEWRGMGWTKRDTNAVSWRDGGGDVFGGNVRFFLECDFFKGALESIA